MKVLSLIALVIIAIVAWELASVYIISRVTKTSFTGNLKAALTRLSILLSR